MGKRPAREDVASEHAPAKLEPGERAFTGLIGELELNRLLGFPLDDGRTVPDFGVQTNQPIFSLMRSAPELAGDRQVKHGQVADPTLALEVKADGPNLFRLEGRSGGR
jgi:hypothetical protein